MARGMKVDLDGVFEGVCGVLRKQGKGMVLLDYLPGSKAGEATRKKRMLHLYGKKEVSVFNKPCQKMYVAGTILQKGYVAFHFMPIYCAPKAFTLSPAMKKALMGKACFHVKAWDAGMEREVQGLLKQGIGCFKKMGWV